MQVLEIVLLWLHGLSGAAWFGSIFYRTVTIDPKARTFFPLDEEYERFSTHLAHNMRYMVWSGLLTCGLSGFGLLGLKWRDGCAAWGILIAAKIVIWAAACALFIYVSYVHWPWRSLAGTAQSAMYRRHGLLLASAMVFLSALGFLLGQACATVGR